MDGATEAASSAPFRLFVLDDDASIGEMLTRALTDAGREVKRFGSPIQALTEVQRDPPDLIITDLNMPGMSGLEFLKRVKAEHPHVEVILITGFGSKEVAIEALRLGVSDFIEKPLELAHVRNLVHEIQSEVMQSRRKDAESDAPAEPAPAPAPATAPSMGNLVAASGSSDELLSSMDFDALFDGACLQILATLSEGSLSAQEIAQKGELPTVTVYRKLSLLEDANIVRCVGTPLTRAGRRVKVYAGNIQRLTVRFDQGSTTFQL